MANPVIKTLLADTDTLFDLGSNFGSVEVSLIANAAVTVFNSTGVVIGSSTPTDGNHTLTTTLPAKTVQDFTTGNTVVHVRSSGTPTVQVYGL